MEEVVGEDEVQRGKVCFLITSKKATQAACNQVLMTNLQGDHADASVSQRPAQKSWSVSAANASTRCAAPASTSAGNVVSTCALIVKTSAKAALLSFVAIVNATAVIQIVSDLIN